MNEEQLKQNKLFYLFSQLNNLKKENVHVMLAVDAFLNDQNNYHSLIDISKEITEIGIVCSPEKLKDIISNIEYSNIFEGFEPLAETNQPFRLKKEYYNNVKDLTNYTKELDDVVIAFLKENDLNQKKKEPIINILLDTLISKNLDYLKILIKPKEQKNFEDYKIASPSKKYKKKELKLYNQFMQSVNGDFNKVLEALLLKLTDFLTLNYNPDVDKFVNEKLGNKKFYLDSSVVLRLLGFDNEIRQERAVRLLELLKKIEGVHFHIHLETLSEAQSRINQKIDESQESLKHSEKLLKRAGELTGKGSNVVDLYFRLKHNGEVQNIQDFTLLFSNVSAVLTKIFGKERFSIDKNKIQKPSGKFDNLQIELGRTQKSSPRVKHITKLLSHIENKRGSNNYNLFDIEFWLITTDQTTLAIDSELIKLDDNKIKSSCILPSELIRLIESAGEIKGDYFEVFRNYMLYSNVFREDYDNGEIETLDKVLTLCESASSSTYDADFLLNNLFDKYSLENIAKRLDKLQTEKSKNEELISLFHEANTGFFEPKFLKLKLKETKRLGMWSNILFFILIFIIPALTLWYLFSVLINPDLIWNDPMTYINESAFSKLEFIVTIFEVGILGLAIYLYRKYRKRFVEWYVKRFSTKFE